MQNLTNEFCELRKQYIDAKFMTMNPMQKKAIYNVDGPVLVLAGAGSGKTTTIIGRIVYMVMFGHAYYSTKTTFPVTENDIKELKSVLAGTGSISEHLKSMLQVKPVSPQNIMAVTFTNKAAGEMKKRLESKLGKDTAEKVCAKTFHSACVGILREYAMFVGFKRDFTIYDEKDCKSVLKDIYKANGIKEKELHKDDVLNHISIWKDKMITPDMAISQSTISSYNTVAHLYKEYQERLKNANAMDFDDLIGNTIRLLKEHPDIQAELQKKIQYIMVDEYQDTNASQHELLSLLISPEHNICVVGDDDQSIYSFRGADVDNILNFPQEFDGTHISGTLADDENNGNVINDYYIPDEGSESSCDGEDSLIFGYAEPEKIVKFAESIPQQLVDCAEYLTKLVHVDGSVLSREFLKDTMQKPLNAYCLQNAFAVLNGEFTSDSPVCCYTNGYAHAMPDESTIEDVRKNPEDYAVIELLFHD